MEDGMEDGTEGFWRLRKTQNGVNNVATILVPFHVLRNGFRSIYDLGVAALPLPTERIRMYTSEEEARDRRMDQLSSIATWPLRH